MEYIAHSAKDGKPSQSYYDHVNNVTEKATKNAEEVAIFSSCDGKLLKKVVKTAASIHDLGKLHDENQEVLKGGDGRKHLPINHVDAGVYALRKDRHECLHAELAIYSHHHGLPNLNSEESRGDDYLRDDSADVRRLVEKDVFKLEKIHKKIFPTYALYKNEDELSGDLGVFERISLSCLVDADHCDTATHYGKYPSDLKEIPLLPDMRLKKLDEYVKSLSKEGDNTERNRLRTQMYDFCRNANITESIVACDSPVGSGKTTSIMAHLLQQAKCRNARRIFVVLPFTNIIQQSVEIYREALCLPGEDKELVVAELHHRADFEDVEARALTSQWRAPIVVTTAVAFFETIASCRPATLRRLHELPGSLIFVDEAHAALPVKLLPLAWHWMEVLADEWQCYWVLASGSLVEFWKLKAEEWKRIERNVPQLLPDSIRDALMVYEGGRIKFKYEPMPLSISELVNLVVSKPGPRLLVMNTVQSAAAMAIKLQEYYGNDEKVLHLSSSLHSVDREAVVKKVKTRLDDEKIDEDWVLVATSCVEAGVDFSFRTGFREVASLLSLLQTCGRVNRNGKYNDSVMWSFSMQDDYWLKNNPGVYASSKVLTKYLENGISIEPSLSTDSMQRELNLTVNDFEELLNAEMSGDFPAVQDKFCVIDTDTVLVVPDKKLQDEIRNGGCDWRDIQKKSISIRKYYVTKYELKELIHNNNLYAWDLGYDEHLGIMKGVLNFVKMETGFLSF